VKGVNIIINKIERKNITEKQDMIKIFEIPIQGRGTCYEYNKEYGTNLKSTEEHFGDMIDDLYDMFEKTGDNGGWYIGDCIEVEIKMKYCPEDK
jgi:hypothetical protein